MSLHQSLCFKYYVIWGDLLELKHTFSPPVILCEKGFFKLIVKTICIHIFLRVLYTYFYMSNSFCCIKWKLKQISQSRGSILLSLLTFELSQALCERRFCSCAERKTIVLVITEEKTNRDRLFRKILLHKILKYIGLVYILDLYEVKKNCMK